MAKLYDDEKGKYFMNSNEIIFLSTLDSCSLHPFLLFSHSLHFIYKRFEWRWNTDTCKLEHIRYEQN